MASPTLGALMPYYSVSGSNYARIIYDKLYDRLAYVQADGTCQPPGPRSVGRVPMTAIPLCFS